MVLETKAHLLTLTIETVFIFLELVKMISLFFFFNKIQCPNGPVACNLDQECNVQNKLRPIYSFAFNGFRKSIDFLKPFILFLDYL